MPDFTLKIYKQLLEALKDADYRFMTFEEYLMRTEDRSPKSEVRSPSSGLRSPFVILRHDVDLLPQNSLAFARIQHEMGIRGSYYFRAVPESWDEDVIKEIHGLGHEVGYHYEDMDLAGRRKEEGKRKTEKEEPQETSGLRSPSSGLPDSDIDFAISSFAKNLEKLRRLVPVTTICMHGSPRSRYDNRDLWKKYDYRDYGIIGEPYFDVDFDEMFYLTDTGRRWDGWKVSIRDKMPQQEEWIRRGMVFRSTQEIIEAARVRKNVMESGDDEETAGSLRQAQAPPLPDHLMMTFHPQRWTDKPFPWLKEWVVQKSKNSVKYFINLRRGNQ